MTTSQRIYLGVVALVALERLVELALTRRNVRWALARGGVEAGRGHYPWMVGLHTVFLAACAVEVVALDRRFVPALGGAMAVLLAAAMALRWWAIATLGRRWSTRVVVLPGEPPVVGGPYRFLRHPNYLAVATEGLALPLLHSAWITALAFTLLDAWLLRVRIGVEERALRGAAGAEYDGAFADRARLLPRPPRAPAGSAR